MTDRNGDIRLSQTLIVKNEEKNIGKALEWGRGLCCEQIVVDTGSTDHTEEIAEKLGARVVRFPWRDDFSAAKNFAISQCQGDWIALLDADEYVDTDSREKLLPLLQNASGDPSVNVIQCSMTNLNDDGSAMSTFACERFFRNGVGIHYVRPIHEQLTAGPGQRLVPYDATGEIRILHTGYSESAAAEKQKSGRNRRMLQAALEKTPHDAELLGYLGDDYLTEGQYGRAAAQYKAAIDEYRGQRINPDWRLDLCYIRLIQARLASGTTQEVVHRLCQEGSSLFPREPDFDYLEGRTFYEAGDYARAAESYQKALRKLNKFGSSSQGLVITASLGDAYYETAFSLWQCGRETEAFPLARDLADTTGRYDAVLLWLAIMSVWRKAGKISLAEEERQIRTFGHPEVLGRRLRLYQAAKSLDDREMKDFVWNMLSQEERAAFRSEG